MDDGTAEAIVAFLRGEGAAELPHGGGRALLEHLLGTFEILRRWGQPQSIQYAGLLHSVYGTDVYGHALIPAARRAAVAAVAGPEAERLAYLFGIVPRRPLYAGTHRWAPGALPLAAEIDPPPSRAEFDALVIVHMANLAEQTRAADGGPARWLVRLRELAELLRDSEAVTLPPFVLVLAAFTESDEAVALRAYRSGEGALAAAACPVIGEPCLLEAEAALRRGEVVAARAWAGQARERLLGLGAAWDKRSAFEEWLERINGLDAAPPEAPDGTGRERFHRYVEELAAGDRPPSGAIYPDLESAPWHDPAGFPLATALEENFEAIRDELLALPGALFMPESERIGRTGDWDVAFLYERGRRHAEALAACPVTARIIESPATVRTMAGLVYVSRMRPGTHIEAHRGPTNLRLRCHLGLVVPDGDCAIRVGDEARPWQPGRCLVFDDHFEHEAWNHTDKDRIVLIVDLWHPGLSPLEVRLLEGLHGYAAFHGRRLSRYWSVNAAARAAARAEAGGAAPRS